MSAIAATTMAGYRAVAPKKLRHRDRILNALELAGKHGLIFDGLRPYFPKGTPDGAISGRIIELENEALIFRAGDVRVSLITDCEQMVIRLAAYSATTLVPKEKTKMTPYLKGFMAASKIVKEHIAGFKGTPASIALKDELERIISRGEKVKETK